MSRILHAWRDLVFFFFNDTATTEIYTLSLHDALPISRDQPARHRQHQRDRERVLRVHDALLPGRAVATRAGTGVAGDRKSTRLNSSHLVISYAVFCFKKKKNILISCNMQTERRQTTYY